MGKHILKLKYQWNKEVSDEQLLGTVVVNVDFEYTANRFQHQRINTRQNIAFDKPAHFCRPLIK